jgi:CheY-like chemotaxis protein
MDGQTILSDDYTPQKPYKVLVVDDSRAQLRITEMRLRRAGAEVISYDDPHAALAYARANPDIDLAVLDFEMRGKNPEGMDGNDLEYKLRQIPALRDITIIIASANKDKVNNYHNKYRMDRRGRTKAVDKTYFVTRLESCGMQTIDEVLAA